MNRFISILLALCTCSCATIKTIAQPTNHIYIAHYGKKSFCENIPRIYSGVSYNFCLFYGEPSERENIGSTINNVPFVFIDSVFSAVTDTIVLPYTIVMQAEKGSLKVN